MCKPRSREVQLETINDVKAKLEIKPDVISFFKRPEPYHFQ